MPFPSLTLYPSPFLLPSPDDGASFTDGILESFDPWLTDDATNYLSALAALYEQVYGLVAPQGFPDDSDYTPGWSILLDPDACPTDFLPYLAQFNGTNVPVGTNDADARATIKAEAGFARGTVASIATAAQRWLNGTQTVTVIERTADSGSPDAYHFQVIVRTSEVVDTTQLKAAVEAVKPAGLTWTLVATTGNTWSSAIHIWSADTMTWQQTDTVAP